MDMRPLGRTGLRVSAIGLGTVKIGRTKGLKHPGAAPVLPSDEQATELIRTAAELGINLIDTAPAYGRSEERIGAIMAANNWFGGRDSWVVCTKAGEEFDDETGISAHDFSPEAIRASVDRSLRRLRVDVLDVVLIHSDGRDEWILEQSGALDALRDLKTAGKIRAVGASTKTVDGGFSAIRSTRGRADVVMLTYNPRDREELPVIQSAALRSVGVLVKKALVSGRLDHITNRLAIDGPEAEDPAQAALRFALARPGVSSVVVGTSRPEHLRTNAAAVR